MDKVTNTHGWSQMAVCRDAAADSVNNRQNCLPQAGTAAEADGTVGDSAVIACFDGDRETEETYFVMEDCGEADFPDAVPAGQAPEADSPFLVVDDEETDVRDAAPDGQASDAGKTSEADAQVCRNADGSLIRGNPEAFFEQMQAQGWQMMSTEGKDFDVIMQKGDLQFAVKWGSGDSKGAEMFLHGDGEQPIKNDKSKNKKVKSHNPFENCSSDSDIIVIQNSAQKKNGTRSLSWEKQAGEIYEVARPFLEQGYDLGINGYSAGGYGACELAEYATGVKGDNTEPLREGQQIILRLFDGVPKPQGGKKGEERIADMLSANPNNFKADFHWSAANRNDISGRTAKAGRNLEHQYGSQVTIQSEDNYPFTKEFQNEYKHLNKELHGLLQFVIADHIPGVVKVGED